jgi:hypothetical protein
MSARRPSRHHTASTHSGALETVASSDHGDDGDRYAAAAGNARKRHR